VAQIETYAKKVRSLDNAHIAMLGAYGKSAKELIDSDTGDRITRMSTLFGSDWSAGASGPSILDAVEIQICDECQHSLALAWLLDPLRAGPIAEPFWFRLLDLLSEKARGTGAQNAESSRLAAIVEGVRAGDLKRVSVRPRSADDEFEFAGDFGRPDVFARAFKQGSLAWALLVEVKTKASTPEQPGQLKRYHDGVAAIAEGDETRTVFVFLAESKRKLVSAGDTLDRWICISWREIAAILLKLSEDADLPPCARVFCGQFRHAIRRWVLGEVMSYILQDRFRMLTLEWQDSKLAPPEGVEATRTSTHSRACELERDAARREGI